MKLIIQITGSRDWKDKARIKRAITETSDAAGINLDECLVVHGGARGADLLSDDAAKALGCDVRAVPADNKIDGPWPMAGPRRNKRMLDLTLGLASDYGCGVVVLAFKADFDSQMRRGGTENMVKQCKAAGLSGRIIRR